MIFDYFRQRSIPMWVLVVALLCESVLLVVVILKVPYTEIDWIAYREQVEIYLGGERDYTQIVGGTGPVVYPATHLYIYEILYHLTDSGLDIVQAQWIFAALYVIFIGAVLWIYKRAKTLPLYALPLICLSKRIHSIFVLRLFNDCWAMTLFYLCVGCFLQDAWYIGCVFYSLAVSVKMSIFLFAPGLLFLLCERWGVAGAFKRITCCAVVQFLVGSPFLLTHPIEYIYRAFNFGKEFEYKWTVNFHFLTEETFLSIEFALTMLVIHVTTLLLFGWMKNWHAGHKSLGDFISAPPLIKNLEPTRILDLLFMSNFIGIVCCKSLHYQFYVWYYHTLPYLLWRAKCLPVVVKLAIWAIIEAVWSFGYFYPPNYYSSIVLGVAHLTLLISLGIGDSRVKPGV